MTTLKHFYIHLASLILFIILMMSQSYAQNYPQYQQVYVNDFINLIPETQEASIVERLQSLRMTHGIEMTVVTIGSRLDYGDSSNIEDFALGMFNDWGVGDAEHNDGVMILVAQNDREMRIQLGDWYSADYNQSMKGIIDQVMLPAFRNNDFSSGITAGVDAVIAQLTDSDGNTLRSPIAETNTHSNNDSILKKILLALLAIPGLGAAQFFLRRLSRRKPRQCKRCNASMKRLTEDQEDQYLDEAKILEEMVKSVDYDVWRCYSCGHMTIKRYPAWFSKYGACPQCQHKTVESDSHIITKATKTSKGREQIDYVCLNCHYTNTEFCVLPIISNSNSSGTFGGGFSSGGGASGSW